MKYIRKQPSLAEVNKLKEGDPDIDKSTGEDVMRVYQKKDENKVIFKWTKGFIKTPIYDRRKL